MPDFTVSAFIDTLMQVANQAAARTALGLGTMATETASNYLTTAAAASTYLTQANAASSYQPLNSNLTAIAVLTTTTFGRSLLTQADAAATRTTLGLGTAATQASTAFLQLAGGAQTIAGTQTTTFSAGVASTSNTTGTIVISGSGGLGVGADIRGANLFANAGGLFGFGNTSSRMYATGGDGNINFTNNGANGFSRLTLGLTTTAFSSIATMTGNGLQIVSGTGTSTFADANTATNGTIANRSCFFIAAPTFSASNTGTTATTAATFDIGGAPTASGVTFTNTALALRVRSGRSFFGGDVAIGGNDVLLSRAGAGLLNLKNGNSPTQLRAYQTDDGVGNSLYGTFGFDLTDFIIDSGGTGAYTAGTQILLRQGGSNMALFNSQYCYFYAGNILVAKVVSDDGGVFDFANQSVQTITSELPTQFFYARVGGSNVKIAIVQ